LKESELGLTELPNRKSLISIVGILLSIFAFYSPVLIGDHVFTWDTLDYSFPLAIYLRDAFEVGTWPFWNPFILSGDAMFAHPAVSAYHPFHLLIAIAPDFIDSHYLLQCLVVSLCGVGALGFRAFLKELKFSQEAQFVGAVVFGITFFGPLLGQPAIAFGIAMFPWVLLAAKKVFSMGHFSVARAGGLAMLSAFTFYGSYFGVTLYLGIFTTLYLLVMAVWKRPSGLAAGLMNILLAAILTFGFICPHILPALENRKLFYADISSEFISPDPVVRGVNLPEQHIVEIIPNERTLFGILLNSKSLASDGAFWVIGPGFSILVLALLTFWPRIRPKRWYLYFGAFLIGESYVLGPKSAVFDFVYSYVPVLNNIRYPVFSFPFVMVALVLLALRNLDTVSGSWSLRNRLLLAGFITAEVFVFGLTTGLWSGNRIPYILSEVTAQERSAMSLQDRKTAASIQQNSRTMIDGSEMKFKERSWVRDKIPISHGYSTSDSPLYWYLKDAKVISQIAYCPTKAIYADKGEGLLSNHEMKAAGIQLSALSTSEVLINKSQTHLALQPCEVKSIVGRPNSWTIEADSASSSLLVLMDKNYPGWTATVDGKPAVIQTVNFLFKAVQVIGPGPHRIEFKFRPSSFFRGVWIAVSTFLILILAIIIQRAGKPLSRKLRLPQV
jgi:hypothetical protein